MVELVVLSLISPINPSPFSISSNSIATFGRPEAVLYSPQGIGNTFNLELSVSSEFSGLLRRYYAGIQYRYVALAWYSISAEDEEASFSEHMFSLGYSFRGIGMSLSAYPEYVSDPNDPNQLRTNWRYGSSLGIIRALDPVWVSISISYFQDRQFGSVSIMYPSENFNIYLDAFMESGYPLTIRTGFLLKLHKRINVLIGYDSGNSVFSAGIAVFADKLRIGYAYKDHPYLGMSNSGMISLRR